MKNTYEIKTKKLENGNGYTFGTVVNGCEEWERPNPDIGENYENQIGVETEGEAIVLAAHYVNWQLSGIERYQQHKDDLLLEAE
jgi:nucleoside phosphorylase